MLALLKAAGMAPRWIHRRNSGCTASSAGRLVQKGFIGGWVRPGTGSGSLFWSSARSASIVSSIVGSADSATIFSVSGHSDRMCVNVSIRLALSGVSQAMPSIQTEKFPSSKSMRRVAVRSTFGGMVFALAVDWLTLSALFFFSFSVRKFAPPCRAWEKA